jgi:hypothetical protein
LHGERVTNKIHQVVLANEARPSSRWFPQIAAAPPPNPIIRSTPRRFGVGFLLNLNPLKTGIVFGIY